MQFLDLVKTRQSVREYLDKPVERAKINRCLEAARLAPSACNDQPWKYIIVDDLQLKNTVAKETFGMLNGVPVNRFTLQAPVLILLVSDQPNLHRRITGIFNLKALYFLIDIGITTAYFCLQAAEEGLGTCVMGNFKGESIKKILKIPVSQRINAIISLGYPKSNEIRPKTRKRLDLMSQYNTPES